MRYEALVPGWRDKTHCLQTRNRSKAANCGLAREPEERNHFKRKSQHHAKQFKLTHSQGGHS